MEGINILGKDITFIAEIGQNHNGSIMIARQLLEEARDCGANFAKLTLQDINESYTEKTLKMPYINRYSYGKTYGSHKKFLEFSEKTHHNLKKYADRIGIKLMYSVCDKPSFELAQKLQNPIIKIPSREITNLPLLELIAENCSKKDVLLSTGLATFQTLDKAVNILQDTRLYILYCISEYPTQEYHIKLQTLDVLKERYQEDIYGIGLSSHYPYPEDVYCAIPYGIKIVEKHLTYDKDARGRDHACSLTSYEFFEMIEATSRIQRFNTDRVGIGNKLPYYTKVKMLKGKQPDKTYKVNLS